MRSVQYAHWHRFFENISVSPLDFYKEFDTELATRKVPDITSARVDKLEGGPLSAKRTYLELQRDWMTYHVCAAPFGTGFFVSSRLIVWPWRSWPVVALGAGIFALFIFIFFIVTSVQYSVIGGFLATMTVGFPTFILFVLSVAVWLITCLRLTYYRMDTMLAFHESVHRLLVAQVNQIVEGAGQKPLTEAEAKPILHKLLER